jgi:hypothetical protein
MVKLMKKHKVDKIDLFEISLSIAKSITFIIDAADLDLIYDIPE